MKTALWIIGSLIALAALYLLYSYFKSRGGNGSDGNGTDAGTTPDTSAEHNTFIRECTTTNTAPSCEKAWIEAKGEGISTWDGYLKWYNENTGGGTETPCIPFTKAQRNTMLTACYNVCIKKHLWKPVVGATLVATCSQECRANTPPVVECP